MENQTKRMGFLFLFTCLIAMAAAVLRTLLLLYYVDPVTGLYVYGSNAQFYFNLLILLLAVYLIAVWVALRNTPAPKALRSDSTILIFASSLCGFMFLSIFIYHIATVASTRQANAYTVLLMVLSIPSCISFLTTSAKSMKRRSALHALLSFAPVLFLAVRMIQYFLDPANIFNSSTVKLRLLMLCAMLLFFVAETGFFIPVDDKDDVQAQSTKRKKRTRGLARYFCFGLCAMSLVVITVLPNLLLSAFWLLQSDTSYVIDILDLSIGLYAAARLRAIVHERKRDGQSNLSSNDVPSTPQ